MSVRMEISDAPEPRGMNPRIETIRPKKVVGVSGEMTQARDSTAQLWGGLMPRRHEIENRVSADYLSIRIYRPPGMTVAQMFSPATVFEKWAAVEVSDPSEVPAGMSGHVLAGGDYAVFTHRGPASTFPRTMRYIFETWLPTSGYELDDREHFEVLTEDWSPADENAREEVWIPIRARPDQSTADLARPDETDTGVAPSFSEPLR